MKISACWIVKNEEKNLARSIESLQNAADELIVVDTGSTDGTVEVARSMGAKVEHFEWTGDFAAARNYAISLAEGDYIIFLDADEWFVPALEQEDRGYIDAIFQDGRKIEAIQLKILNVNIYGIPESTTNVDRMFLKHPQIYYHNRIHERLLHETGRPMRKLMVNNRWEIHHSGYTMEVMPQKMRRNIGLLELALENSPEDNPARFMQQLYLIREHMTEGRPDLSLPYLNAVLQNPGKLKATCQEYGENFVDFLYIGIECAYTMRSKVSREEVRRRLVTAMQKQFPKYPGAATIELFYQSWFDLKEDRFLSDLPAALRRADSLPPSNVRKHKEIRAMLCYTAARALWLRRRKVEALDYAALACQDVVNDNPHNLQILLGCMRGIPVGEVASFLTGLYDLSNPRKLRFLVEETRIVDYDDLHIYFLKKQIDVGYATKGAFLYIQLMLGKYDESEKFAREIESPENERAIAEHFFMMSICTGQERYYRDNADKVGVYSRLLDAFFAGSLPDATAEDANILEFMYGRIAFAGGIEAADRLRALYTSLPGHAYRVKAQYCVRNEMYDLLLQEDMDNIPADDSDSREYRIRALVMTGRYLEALVGIEALLDLEKLDNVLLSLLLAVADSATGDVAKRARELYERYIVVYDAAVDLRDIVNTGTVFDDYSKKQMTVLKMTNKAQLKKRLDEEAKKPALAVLKELYSKAAEIYEQRGMLGPAIDCYCWLVAHDCDRENSRESLVRLFRALGNNNLDFLLTEKQENMVPPADL